MGVRLGWSGIDARGFRCDPDPFKLGIAVAGEFDQLERTFEVDEPSRSSRRCSTGPVMPGRSRLPA